MDCAQLFDSSTGLSWGTHVGAVIWMLDERQLVSASDVPVGLPHMVVSY